MVCSSPVTWSATGSSSPAASADLYKRLRKTAAEETRLRKINFLKKILCFPSYSVKYVLVMVTEVHVKHGETFKLTRSAYEINADSVSGSFFLHLALLRHTSRPSRCFQGAANQELTFFTQEDKLRALL